MLLFGVAAGSWLPGWGKYIAACGELDRIVADILAERRALAASSGRQNDLVGYLLQAQQQQGSDVITDEQIGFEIKTMMFGGSDTSSFALALLAHQLAVHPGAADRAAAEVAAVLQERRGDVMQLTANDAARMPFVTACVNETLRLTPAGPGITRTATQVRWRVAGRATTLTIAGRQGLLICGSMQTLSGLHASCPAQMLHCMFFQCTGTTRLAAAFLTANSVAMLQNCCGLATPTAD